MLKRFTRSRSETFELRASGLPAPVTVRRSPRASRFTLSVNDARRAAVLTMPAWAELDEAGAFLSKHFEWLKGKLEELPPAVPFADGAVVPLRGEQHRIVFTGTGRARGVVTRERPDGAMPRLCVAGAPEHAPRRLTDWLKREARKDLTARCRWHAENLGLNPGRVSVRDQTTRWGSCSQTGVMSFSWRLVLAPPRVLDYVAAHEVAHLKHMNHGPRFWTLVRKTMPETDEARRWLRTHGARLHRYGADS